MVTKKIKKGARKKFFDVEIPLISTKAKLYGYSPEDFENKIIKIDLTKNLRGKNLELRAKVFLSNEELNSKLIVLQLIQSYLRKIIKRGTDYVEDSFVTGSKDSKLRVKPFMMTRKRVSRAIRNEIRKLAKRTLESHITLRNTQELFSEIMTNKLQKLLSQKIKKIYPLAVCEIRMIEVIEYVKEKKSNKKSQDLDSEKD